MKQLILVLLMTLVSMTGFAGGTGTGGQPKIDELMMQDHPKAIMDRLPVQQEPNQVYYMRHKQAEIEFATTNPGDDKVDIKSLRPEEISSPAVLDGLKRSQQSRQWENVKIPSDAEMKRNIQKFDLNIRNMGIRY